MHNHPLDHEDGGDLIATSTPIIMSEIKSNPYPYTFHTTFDMPSTLADLHAAGVYAFDSQAMMPVETERTPQPTSQPSSLSILRKVDHVPVVELIDKQGTTISFCGFNMAFHSRIKTLAHYWSDHQYPASFV